MSISTIYVRLPNWIGDVCMALASLRALIQTNLRIIVCARPWAKDLLAGESIDDFISIEGQLWQDCQRVRAHVKKNLGRACGLLLTDSLSSAIIFRFAGLPSAGYRDEGRSILLRWVVEKPIKSLHAVEAWYYLTNESLNRWNLLIKENKPGLITFNLTPSHYACAQNLLQNNALKDKSFVLIAPTATGLHQNKNKVWPGFDRLTRALQAKGYLIIMCPPLHEVEQALRNAPSARLLAPLSLGALAALTRFATLVICNDSGVSHISAAAGARQITIFGVTPLKRTAPWSSQAICLGSQDTWPEEEEVIKQAITLLEATN